MSKSIRDQAVSTEDARAKMSDLEVKGNPDVWHLLCKTSSKSAGFAHSTKVMAIPGLGCLVQVSTNEGGNPATALAYVPGASLRSFGLK